MKYKKLLQIGCGGIGSEFIDGLENQINKGQIDPYLQITVADNDMVEDGQVRYQNFSIQDVGLNKAQAIRNRWDGEIKAIKKRITRGEELKKYDIIILCVDNNTTRREVIKYCHKNNKEFLDLRCNGRRIFAMPKTILDTNLDFTDEDTTEYSCQEQADLEKGYFQIGNQIVATIGVQMLLNLLRGHNNRIISEVI